MGFRKIGLAISFLAFLCLSYIYFPESIDDAYITLRFSKNLALGNGPIFNIGERVEGYSNVSWMALLALMGRVGIPMEIAMKILGIIAGSLTIFIVWKLSKKWFTSDAAVGVAVFLLGFSSFFAVWSADGLETTFYTFLLTVLVYLLSTFGVNSFLIGTVAGVVALTRPEGIMFGLIAVACLVILNGLAAGFKAFIPLAACFGGYELFRIGYFGNFVPNTAVAKVHPSLSTVAGGLRYLNAFNVASGFLILPTAMIGAITARKNKQIFIPILFILAQVFFLLVSNGDFMFAYRFIIPVLPCIALLCGAAVDLLAAHTNRAFSLSALVILVAVQAYFQYTSLPEKHIETDNLAFRSAPHFLIAEFINRNTEPEDWVLLSEAGIIPYYIDAKVVDYLGLVSPYYSVYNSDLSINNAYIFANKPKYVVLSFVEDQSGAIKPRLGPEWQISIYPELLEHYQAVQSFDIVEQTSFLNSIYYYYAPDAKRIFFTVFERVQ